MAEGGTVTFSDANGYASAFRDAHIDFTITAAGDFKGQLTWLKLKHLEVYRSWERLPRIAYISLPAERIFLSFPVGAAAPTFDGFALRSGDMIFHSRGERVHQRSNGRCQWGLISLSPEQLANCSKALTGQPIAPPLASRILRPSRAEASKFQSLVRQACHLAETKRRLIARPEVARGLEQELLYAIIHCLDASEADNHPTARHHCRSAKLICRKRIVSSAKPILS